MCEYIPSSANTIADALSRGEGFPFAEFEGRNIFRIYPYLLSLENFVKTNSLYLFDRMFLSMFPTSQVSDLCDSHSILEFEFRNYINPIRFENERVSSQVNQSDPSNTRNNFNHAQNNAPRGGSYGPNYYQNSQSSNPGPQRGPNGQPRGRGRGDGRGRGNWCS